MPTIPYLIRKFIPILLCAYAFTLYSCGKKEPPRLPLYDKPPQRAEEASPPKTPDETATKSAAPSKPEGLEAFVTEDRVVLFWKENPERELRGYRIYRAGPDEIFKEVGTTQTPAFVDRGKLLKKRFYKISAIGPEGDGPFSGPIVVKPQ